MNMPTLNIADLSLAIVWLYFGIRGYLRGLVKEAGSLAAVVLAFYCAGTYHRTLTPHLTKYISGDYAGTASYLLLFTVTLLGVWFLALAISGIVKVTMTQWADRLFGGAFGLGKGVALTAVLLFLIHLAAPHPDFLKDSRLVPVIDQLSAKLIRFIPPDINEKLRRLGKKNPFKAAATQSEQKPAPAKAAVETKARDAAASPEKKPAPTAKATEKAKTEAQHKDAKAQGPDKKTPAADTHAAKSDGKPKGASAGKTAAKAESTEKKP